MKQNLITIGSVLLSMVLLYIILNMKYCSGIKSNTKVPIGYWQAKGFRVDTVFVPKPYKVKGDSFPYLVYPKIVKVYPPDPFFQGLNSPTISCKEDSLIEVINKLNKHITLINQKFLTQFTMDSKLVYGLFNRDTVRLDILKIDGNLQTNIYPTDYGNFKYEFKDDQLRADTLLAREKPRVKPKIISELYGSAGYEIFSKNPTASFDYYLRYRKLQLDLEPTLLIRANPALLFQAKLGIKLK